MHYNGKVKQVLSSLSAVLQLSIYAHQLIGLLVLRKGLLNILIDNLDSPEILDMSLGNQLIDLTYIVDVVDAFIKAGCYLMHMWEKSNGELFFSGERLTVKQLVEVVQSVSTKILKVRFGGRPYTNREVMILFNIGSKKCLNGLLRTSCVNLLAKSSTILMHEAKGEKNARK